MLKAYYPQFDLLRRANSIFLTNYQPSKTPIVEISENLYKDVISQRAKAILTNSLPNSIARAAILADTGRRLDTTA